MEEGSGAAAVAVEEGEVDACVVDFRRSGRGILRGAEGL